MFIGTTNPGKVAEFAAILAPLGVPLEVVALDVPETTDTFEGNARQKALAYAAQVGEVVVSEDSGLGVTALDGLPGPWSARFSDCVLDGHRVVGVQESGRTREEIDAANNARVLALLVDVPMPHRAAKFVVHLVVARPGKVLFEAHAEVHGWISDDPRGTHGFGYDPIFVGQDTFGKTFAELDPVRKNIRSHRKKVLAEFGLWAAQAVKDGVLRSSEV